MSCVSCAKCGGPVRGADVFPCFGRCDPSKYHFPCRDIRDILRTRGHVKCTRCFLYTGVKRGRGRRQAAQVTCGDSWSDTSTAVLEGHVTSQHTWRRDEFVTWPTGRLWTAKIVITMAVD
ncbi:hypothetical protein J6590_045702 [Homalodisca vitripennis]|nr:hypothetical protein J6590_045702 [Homalodisca vitripennis]